MKTIKILVIATAISLICPSNLLAWGRKGHSLVAEVAFKNISPNTQKIVLKYLDGLSIEDAASWMDDQRSDKTYDYLKPLHYVNVEKGEIYNKNSTNNIITEINRVLSDFEHLSTLTDQEIKMDLYEIFHLMGDLHQPFHVGYGTDKGGNTYQIQFDGQGSNLHRLWDSEIIDAKNITLSTIENLALSERNKPIDLNKWFNDSRVYMDKIYPSGNVVDENYINAGAKIIEIQLANAGVRLSNILEKYFKNFNREPQFIKQETKIISISIDKINDYIGQTVKVCTKIYGTKELSSVTFLNCGAAYPNSPLTAVIFKSDLANFKNNPAEYYDGKTVCITGKVVLYKEKPEIILKDETQIEVK
jgi:hypothetical protein